VGAELVAAGVLVLAIVLTLAMLRLALAVASYFDRHNGKGDR
jgi:hypothetical protein